MKVQDYTYFTSRVKFFTYEPKFPAFEIINKFEGRSFLVTRVLKDDLNLKRLCYFSINSFLIFEDGQFLRFRLLLWFWNSDLGAGCVKISAFYSLVGQYFTFIIPVYLRCFMQWFLISICFVLLVYFSLSSILMHDWMPSYIVMVICCCQFTCSKSLRIHNSYCNALAADTYSASGLDNAMQHCFFINQCIEFLPNKNRFPLVRFRLWVPPAQSESLNNSKGACVVSSTYDKIHVFCMI